MSDLFQSIRELLKKSAELAAEQTEPIDYHQDVIESAINYYENIIERANRILDRNKNKVFNDVLNLNTRGEMERALSSYTKAYLLGLNLSLDSTCELAQSLIMLCKKFKVEPSRDWLDVSQFKMGLGEVDTKLKYIREIMEI